MDELPKTIGFPRMKKEPGERRVFLPEFIQKMAMLGLEVYIEEGYGSRSGFSFDDFCQGEPLVRMCDHQEAYRQDIVLVLRSPNNDEFEMLRPESCLISMLHYPTRPHRVELLHKLKISAISLDSIVDDNNLRLVENMKAVAWNGLEAAFDVLEERWPVLMREDGRPWHVLVLGTGMVGKYAVDAGCKLGNVERYNDHIQRKGSGALVTTLGRSLTGNEQWMEKLIREADILVDATQRRDVSRPVVPNQWISWLPEHAVITDLAVDPYNLKADPPVVRGVEGIPQGNLDQYVFQPDDPNWNASIPAEIPAAQRRTTVTCYSWPGIHPEACMRHYAQQLEPLMEVLIEKGYPDLTAEGSYFERALHRATLSEWLRLHE